MKPQDYQPHHVTVAYSTDLPHASVTCHGETTEGRLAGGSAPYSDPSFRRMTVASSSSQEIVCGLLITPLLFRLMTRGWECLK
ncbi:mCG147754 [Mus musculus]|nr:mCG147754 [Mus musculus]